MEKGRFLFIPRGLYPSSGKIVIGGSVFEVWGRTEHGNLLAEGPDGVSYVLVQSDSKPIAAQPA